MDGEVNGAQEAQDEWQEGAQVQQQQHTMQVAELAAACGKTPSRLTQIVSDLDRLGLLATVRTGRVKRYRLSACGAQVLEGLREQDGGS